MHIRSMALALGMTLALSAAQGSAQEALPDLGQAVIGAPIVPPTHSVEQADAKLEEVAKGRAALEAQFGAREQVCYARFFVSNCLDKAKEQRRSGLAQLRAIEVEARHFKRAASVDKRDEALLESAQAAQQDSAQRAAAPPKRVPQAAEPVAPPASAKSPAQRQAEYDAKTQARQARDAAEAGQRTANAAAFEARQRDSEARQRRVLARQAEKQEKARKDAAAAEESARKEALAAAAAAANKK